MRTFTRPTGLLRFFAVFVLCIHLAGCAGIATQPTSQTVQAGQTATFTVVGESTVSGATLTYQWYQNGVAVPGATGASYSFVATAPENGNTYYVIVSDGSSTTATSNTVTLTVTPALSSLTGTIGGPGAYDNASPTIARFAAPYGAATDSAGNLYVADTYNSTIRKITPAGVVSTLAGSAGLTGSTDGTGSAARFYQPKGIAVDSSGNVYVADTINNTIRKVTSAGVVTTLAGTAGQSGSTDGTGTAASFNRPWGLAVDASGNVYVADSANNTVRVVSAAGVVTTLAGTAGQGGLTNGSGSAARFTGPEGIALDPSTGTLIVVDTYNTAIRRVSTAGVVTTVDQGGFAQPMAAAVDAQGNIYVSDSFYNTVSKVSPSGTVSSYAGISGNMGTVNGSLAAATFYSPAGLALDSSGNLYVTDSGDSVANNHPHFGVQGGQVLFAEYEGSDIRKISGGQVSTFAGSVVQTGAANGAAASATFFGPYGLATDSSGNLYIADSQNDTIRKLAGSTVSTLAGTTGQYAETNGTGAAAAFATPSAMAADSSGNLYVTDTGGGTVRKITSAGVVTTLAGQGTAGLTLNQPAGVTVDASGNVYVADTLNRCIHEIPAAGGTATTFAGTCNTGGSALLQPAALAVDSSGNIYVADTGFNVIDKITSSGTVSVLAGSTGAAGSADGTGTAASFSGPQGLAVDSAGDVYVADTLNSTIRKITSAGVVTTVVGQAGVAGFQTGVSGTNRIAYPKQLAIHGQTLYITTDSAVVAVSPLP